MDLTVNVSGLGPALVQQHWLQPYELQALLQQAAAASLSFIEQLLQSRRLSARAVAEFAAQFFGFPLFDLSIVEVADLPQRLLARECLVSWRIIPLSINGNTLLLGASDPTLALVFDAVRLMTGLAVEVRVVEEDKLAALLRTTQHSHADTLAMQTEQQLAEPGGIGHVLVSTEYAWPHSEDAPIVHFLRQILAEAVRGKASDVHFEPYDTLYRIRYRIDGKLRTLVQPPLALKERVALCIKVISRLDIAEKRLPQDGQLTLPLSAERAIDFRVSTLPTLFGEKIVLRILSAASVPLAIDALGLERCQQAMLQAVLARHTGMILVTGPTGSGKTVSLYSCLALLNQADRNIATVEDPVEIVLPGVNQVNVNSKAGLTFAKALRALLRQDPDVLMIGEIRDTETANIAVNAAETGHLVLATLHTHNAPAALTRLLNLDVAPYNIAGCVTLIMAQRLVRRLCQYCRQAHAGSAVSSDGVGDEQGDARRQRTQCFACHGSGYHGRVGVFEVMTVTDEVRQLIMQRASSSDIARLARQQGMIDLRHAGLMKVNQGLTSLTEVLAVAPDEG